MIIVSFTTSGFSGFPEYSGYYSGFDSVFGGLNAFDTGLHPSLYSGLHGTSSIFGSNQNTDSVVTDAKQVKSASTQKPEQLLPSLPTAPSVKPLEKLKPADESKPTEGTPEGNNDE